MNEGVLCSGTKWSLSVRCVFQHRIWLFAGTPCWECSPSDGCCSWKLEKRRAAEGVMTEGLSLICWYVWSVFHLDCHIKFNLKSNANYPNHRTNTMLMLDDYEKKAGFGSTSLQAICFLTVKCFTCLPPLPGNDVGAEHSQQDKMFAVIVPANHRSVQLCVIGYKPYWHVYKTCHITITAHIY